MRAAVLAAMAMCGLATGAEAAAITQTILLQSQTNEQVFGTYFDPSLGTLTSTTFEYAGSYAPAFTVTGTSTVSSFAIVPRIEVQGVAYALPSETATLSGNFANAPAQTFDITGALQGNFQVAAPGTVALFAAPVGVPFDLTASGTLPAGLTLADSEIGTPGGTFTLTYTYDAAASPVPEPVSMALLGHGLFGLAAMRRRGSRAPTQ